MWQPVLEQVHRLESPTSSRRCWPVATAVMGSPCVHAIPIIRRARKGAKPILRVGEATNPGPPHAGWRTADDVKYRDPSITGFWQARAPGHAAIDVQGDGWRSLRIVTSNATSWGPLQQFMLRSDADVILAQEHRLPPWKIAEASDWSRRHNWHALLIPARDTGIGGWSGGVGILARPRAALSAPRIGSETIAESRIIAACVEPPGHRPCLVISAYLQDGAGLSPVNLGHLAAMGTCVRMHGDNHPFVIGGDFQVPPEELANAGFGDQVGGTLISSGAARGTCRTSRHSSELDYFFVNKALALAVKSIDTIEDAGTRPHVPVALTFHPRVTTSRALFLRLPQPLPVERVYGPMQREPDWDDVKTVTRKLAEDARHCNIDGEFIDRYRAAYSAWADRAEIELVKATGHQDPIKYGLRGREPKLVWRSIVPEKVRDPACNLVINWRIIAGVANDVLRISAHRLGPRPVDGDPDAEDDATAGDGALQDGIGLNDDDDGTLYLRQLDECIDVLRNITHHDGDTSEAANRLFSLVEKVRGCVQRAIDCLADANGTTRGAFLADARLASDRAEVAAAALNIRAEITAKMDAAAAAERAAAYKGWKDWLLRNIDSGARNAHKYLRLPVQWRPTTTLVADGVVSADPLRLLDGYRNKYMKLWQGCDADDDGTRCGGDSAENRTDNHAKPWRNLDRQTMGRMTPAQIRQAAATFKTSTSSTYDGFALRQYTLLSDASLDSLADIFEVIEMTSDLPPQAQLATMPLIGKSRGATVR